VKRGSAMLGIALGLAVLTGSPGLCPAADHGIAGADELGASRAAARAGDGELAPSEVVRDASMEPGETGPAQLPRALAAQLGEALEQKAARAAEGAMASLEPREAERADELTRSASRRVKQGLAGVVERRLLPAPSGGAEFVTNARGEVSRPSADAAAGTASETTPLASVDGSLGSSSTIAVGAAYVPASPAPELLIDIEAGWRESTRSR